MTARSSQAGFLVEALRAGDAGAAESAALLLLSGGMPLAQLYDEIVLPFFSSLRTDLESGGMRVVDEHLASRAAIELSMLLGRRQTPWSGDVNGSGGRGVIVLGAVPREQHLLGVRMLAQVLTSRGWFVHLVDALPFELLASYCASLPEKPRAIGLTMHSASSATALRTGLRVLRASVPDVPIVLGGAAVTTNPGLPAKVGAAAGALGLADGLEVLELVTNPLTRREREILGLVASGASNSQIATRLSVHSSTVKTHLEHVAGKLGTSDRTAAAVQGLRRGWID